MKYSMFAEIKRIYIGEEIKRIYYIGEVAHEGRHGIIQSASIVQNNHLQNGSQDNDPADDKEEENHVDNDDNEDNVAICIIIFIIYTLHNRRTIINHIQDPGMQKLCTGCDQSQRNYYNDLFCSIIHHYNNL